IPVGGGFGRIKPHLPGKRPQGREAPLIAESRHEPPLDLPAIKVTLEIEHVRLEQGLGAADGGARAEARDAVAFAVVRPAHPHGEYAGDRGAPPLERHVGGGKSQLHSEAAPGLHPAPQRPGAADAAPRAVEIAARERSPYATAADALAIERHGGDHIDLETEPPAGLGQDGRSRLAASREAEVMSHDDDPRLELP